MVNTTKKLDDNTKLTLIKLVHTAIWCVFAAAIFYILYAGIFDRVNILVWFCVGLVFLEAAILLTFKWQCPFTLLGQRYTDDPYVGFDIFLPTWLARNNKTIFSILFSVGLALVLWRTLGI